MVHGALVELSYVLNTYVLPSNHLLKDMVLMSIYCE